MVVVGDCNFILFFATCDILFEVSLRTKDDARVMLLRPRAFARILTVEHGAILQCNLFGFFGNGGRDDPENMMIDVAVVATWYR